MSRLYSLWLTPDDYSAQYVEDIINKHSRQYTTPPFEPHLTLLSGQCMDVGSCIANCDTLITGHYLYQITLQIQAISYSNVFFKTLFIQFEKNTYLQSMHIHAQSIMPKTEKKIFFPHISLLYANLSLLQKKGIADKLTIPIKEIGLSNAILVSPKTGATNWYDIKNWRIWYKKKLGEKGP